MAARTRRSSFCCAPIWQWSTAPARPLTTWGISSAPPRPGRTWVCNIPGTCVGFTDLRGRPIAPYYLNASATSVSGVNPSPAAYNALLNSVDRQQKAGFWTAEQAVSNLYSGHYQTSFGHRRQGFRRHRCALDGGLSHLEEFRPRRQPRPAVQTNTYLYQFPNYQSWQSELTVNGTGLGDRLKWTSGLFYFRERSPNDGGYLYLFLPSAGSAPSPVAGRQLTVTDSSRNSEDNASYAFYAQATSRPMPTTRVTAGIRYTYDERFAHIATQTVRTPATQATSNTVVDGVFNPAGFTFEGITYAGQTNACALTNANGVLLPLAQCSADIKRSFHKPTYTLAVVRVCRTAPWSMPPCGPVTAPAPSTPRRSIPRCWWPSPSR